MNKRFLEWLGIVHLHIEIESINLAIKNYSLSSSGKINWLIIKSSHIDSLTTICFTVQKVSQFYSSTFQVVPIPHAATRLTQRWCRWCTDSRWSTTGGPHPRDLASHTPDLLPLLEAIDNINLVKAEWKQTSNPISNNASFQLVLCKRHCLLKCAYSLRMKMFSKMIFLANFKSDLWCLM